MITPLTSKIPLNCDVLVVGAGPAGCACATKLAQNGWNVLLVDQFDFPRDKVCGDALIPDAHAALNQLGIYSEVLQHAKLLRHLTLIGPRNGALDIPATVAVIPRMQLDEILRQHACKSGAKFYAPVKFVEPLITDGRVTGAILKSKEGLHSLNSKWVVLATGAQPQAIQVANLCKRRTPSGIALRGYIKHPEMGTLINSMQFICNKALKNGYGWIFPGPDGIYNIGVGLIKVKPKSPPPSDDSTENLNHLFKIFCENHAPASKLVKEGEWIKPLRGAPLRCSLAGSNLGRPGLIATGEAIGSTYSLTGEGIGKALETGILCADSLLSSKNSEHSIKTDESVCQHYEKSLKQLLPKYEIYERATKIYAYPWLMDILIWRARSSQRILQHMAGVVNETSDPTLLFTWRGLRRILLG